jgi:hypothetical protein
VRRISGQRRRTRRFVEARISGDELFAGADLSAARTAFGAGAA